MGAESKNTVAKGGEARWVMAGNMIWWRMRRVGGNIEMAEMLDDAKARWKSGTEQVSLCEKENAREGDS